MLCLVILTAIIVLWQPGTSAEMPAASEGETLFDHIRQGAALLSVHFIFLE